MKDSDPNYETYYYKINSSGSWVDYKNVTDYGSEVGAFPTVTTSTDRVHVSYNTGTHNDPYYNQGIIKTRDKYQASWQTPQTVWIGNMISSTERLFSDNNTLFVFFHNYVYAGQIFHLLWFNQRAVGGTSWTAASQMISTIIIGSKLVSVSKTSDGQIHVVYGFDDQPRLLHYRSYDGSNWSSSYSIANLSSWNLNSFSHHSVSNDLFITWKESSSDNVKYRQYDADPLASRNLSVTAFNGRPRLQ